MATLQLRNLRKRYGALEVIKGVNLDIDDREFVVFVGPSGCGKSTLLRMIAGLEDVDDGEILIDGRDVIAVPPAGRELAMVFQNYALYPHMTVFDNMAFGLRRSGHKKDEIERRIAKAADLLKIAPLLKRKPRDMSGGQRQRVAIGRAIVREPRAFLFDEPLSNLDASLRAEMRTEILALHRRLATTMIFVTHDQVEAMTLANKIVVMNAGQIEQVGSPMELYTAPKNLFVARFIGSPTMNTLRGTVRGQSDNTLLVDLPDGTVVGFDSPARPLAAGDGVTVGLRASHVVPALAGNPALGLEVEFLERLGDRTLVHGQAGGSDTMVASLDGTMAPPPGERLALSIAPGAGHLFDATGLNIPVKGARIV